MAEAVDTRFARFRDAFVLESPTADELQAQRGAIVEKRHSRGEFECIVRLKVQPGRFQRRDVFQSGGNKIDLTVRKPVNGPAGVAAVVQCAEAAVDDLLRAKLIDRVLDLDVVVIDGQVQSFQEWRADESESLFSGRRKVFI